MKLTSIGATEPLWGGCLFYGILVTHGVGCEDIEGGVRKISWSLISKQAKIL